MWDGSDLELLKVLRGPLYVRRRDAALASLKDVDDFAAQIEAQPDPRLRLAMGFVLSWARDRERYEAFDRSLDTLNVELESRRVTGLGGALRKKAREACEAHGDRLLPFCWERVVKLDSAAPVWKLSACLEVIRQIGGESSVEPLLWCVDESENPELLDAVHQILLVLPFQGLKERFVNGMSVHKNRQFVYEDLLIRIRQAEKKKR